MDNGKPREAGRRSVDDENAQHSAGRGGVGEKRQRQGYATAAIGDNSGHINKKRPHHYRMLSSDGSNNTTNNRDEHRHQREDTTTTRNNGGSGGVLQSIPLPSYHDIWKGGDLKKSVWHKSTMFARPEFVGGYERTRDGSFRTHRQYGGGGADCRVYRPAKIGSDLNAGMDRFVPKRENDPDSKGSLANIWKAYQSPTTCANDTTRKSSRRPPHVCTFRNNLNKILETPFNKKDGWKMGVKKRNGIVFLDVQQPSEEGTEDAAAAAEKRRTMQRFVYYGYKFESLSTQEENSHDNNNKDDDDVVVDANEEYCGLFRTNLARHHMLIAAEMDCCSHSNRNNNNNPDFIELKTSRIISHDRQRQNFEKFKLLKYWIQSFLVGTKSIVVGFRDDPGILQKIETLETARLPRIGFEKKYWSANTCLRFADKILAMLRDSVAEDDDDRSYVLEYKAPFREVILRFAQRPEEKVDLSFL